jgi:hypothetical protein
MTRVTPRQAARRDDRSCYIGVKTGLFRVMAGKGGMRVEDVARETKLVLSRRR